MRELILNIGLLEPRKLIYRQWREIRNAQEVLSNFLKRLLGHQVHQCFDTTTPGCRRRSVCSPFSKRSESHCKPYEIFWFVVKPCFRYCEWSELEWEQPTTDVQAVLSNLHSFITIQNGQHFLVSNISYIFDTDKR